MAWFLTDLMFKKKFKHPVDQVSTSCGTKFLKIKEIGFDSVVFSQGSKIIGWGGDKMDDLYCLVQLLSRESTV